MTRELSFEEADRLAEAERLGTFEQAARELTGWTEPGTIRMQGRGWGELQLVLVPHASS